MKTFPLPVRPGSQGSTVILTLVMMLVLLLIFTGIFKWSAASALQTVRNNQYNMSQAAAEGAAEAVLAAMQRDFNFSALADVDSYNSQASLISQAGWPIGYTFTVSNYLTAATAATVQLTGRFVGLQGITQTNEIYVTATPTNAQQTVPATVHMSQQFCRIPLFQYAIFYNINLEIDPGAGMTIGGKVFSNQNIWASGGGLTFMDTVQAHGTNCVPPENSNIDPFCTPGKSDSAVPTFRYQPVDGCPSVTLPIGTNNEQSSVRAMLDIPPEDYALTSDDAYSTNGMEYPANRCDLFITNFPWGTNDGLKIPQGSNTIVYFQNALSSPRMQPVPYDLVILSNIVTRRTTNFTYTPFTTTNYPTGFTNNSTNTIIVFSGYTFVTNAVFYDWREAGSGSQAKRVEALEINVTNLTLWLKNSNSIYGGKQFNDRKVTDTGHNIMGIYVYNAVPFTNMQLPAVRMTKGARLPVLPYPTYSACPKTNGLTVATKFPMYVRGNYNSQSDNGIATSQFSTNNISATTNTYPAALMADAITILSTNWQDGISDTNKNPTGSRGPGNTTVNAAMVEGIVASVNPSYYCGGVENFLRLLEDWNNGTGGVKQTLTYNGSICVLFESQYATNRWGNGCYGVPNRNWAFDVNFKDSNLLPPMTPMNKGLARLQWSTK